MFFIPTGTDAPLYYRPIGTILLIVTNVVCFHLTGWGEGPLAETFLLEYGNGLHPLQWLLCNFLHFGIPYLVGNMLFLWIFGLVVEGKIGTLKFLGMYLSIGILGGFIEQTFLLAYSGFSPGSGGASLAIFGLMAISLLWAPRNEISFIGIFMFRAFCFELSIMTVSAWYLGTCLLAAWWGDFTVSSEMLHLLGAALGGGLGWLFLKREWVDCEGWDIFSDWKGISETQWHFESYRDRSNPYRALQDDEPIGEVESEDRRRKKNRMLKKFRKALAEANLEQALEQRRKLLLLQGDGLFTRDDLHQLIKQLLAAEQLPTAVPLLEEFLLRFPEDSTRHRLKLVELCLKPPLRPGEAKHLLNGLRRDKLSETERKHAARLQQRAEELLTAGVYEIV